MAAEGTTDDPDDERARSEAELGAAVEDALEPELKRRRALFVQRYLGLDRGEGVGRGEAHWDDRPYRDLGADPPDGPAG
jgi:hypothetical protein